MLLILIQRCYPLHILICKFKIKDRNVLTDMIWIAGTGNYPHAFLQILAKDYLRHRFTVGSGNFL